MDDDSLQPASPSRPGPTPLEAEVAARVQVLPILGRQLLETAAHVERAVTEVCHSFEEIVALAHRLVESSGQAETGTGQLTAEVRGAVVALQFQDMVSQRITHVVQALAEMHAALLPLLPAGAVEAAREQALAGLLARYTMQAERDVLDRGGPGRPVEPGAEKIELF